MYNSYNCYSDYTPNEQNNNKDLFRFASIFDSWKGFWTNLTISRRIRDLFLIARKKIIPETEHKLWMKRRFRSNWRTHRYKMFKPYLAFGQASWRMVFFSERMNLDHEHLSPQWRKQINRIKKIRMLPHIDAFK